MERVHESQLANAVLMIRPVHFLSNPHTAASNRFQTRTGLAEDEQQAIAAQEFDALASALESAGIRVCQFEDTAEPHTPDSLFPNNWISTHADGTVVLYPMEAINRRTERRPDIVESLGNEQGFVVRDVVDLTSHEDEGRYLEGTGSLVLDRVNRIAYACLSSRTSLEALADFAQRVGYDVVAFDAVDRGGFPIYHTNVVMNVGEKMAVICADSIARPEQRDAVIQRLATTGHEVILLSFDQLEAFAGNMLELQNDAGERVIAMSRQAWNSLESSQQAQFAENGRVVSVPIDHIEKHSGGSVRCMLAEIHLPTRE
jgi:hypothetical protein